MNTFFLAAAIGWYLVVFSIIMLIRREHLLQIMQNVSTQPGLFFVFALITFILGLLMVLSHNYWFIGWPLIVTIISWLVLISGIFRLAFPDTAMRIGTSYLSHPMKLNIVAAILLILGLFLLFKVYSSIRFVMP